MPIYLTESNSSVTMVNRNRQQRISGFVDPNAVVLFKVKIGILRHTSVFYYSLIESFQ